MFTSSDELFNCDFITNKGLYRFWKYLETQILLKPTELKFYTYFLYLFWLLDLIESWRV